MSDYLNLAPEVNFTQPLSSGGTLFHRLYSNRVRIKATIEDLEAVEKDIEGYGQESQRYAGFAMASAAVLMVADLSRGILEACPGATGTGSRFLFKRWDNAEENARKLFRLFGKSPVERSDLLRGIQDKRAQGVLKIKEDVELARHFLSKRGINPPQRLGTIMDAGARMAESTALLFEASATRETSQINAQRQAAKVREVTSRLRIQLLLIDDEMTRLWDQAMMVARTA